MAIPQQIIDNVRERVSFADVAAEFVELKRSGSRFSARCPFHQEKTPSFFINEEDGLFHCFGCGKKGSVFDFVMELRGLTFPEAVRYLGRRVGIEVTDDYERNDAQGKRRHEHIRLLHEVVCSAARVYRSVIEREIYGRIGRDYLQNRGISEETARLFCVGFAPNSWRFLAEQVERDLKEHGKTIPPSERSLPELLLECGLLKPRDRRQHFSGEEADIPESPLHIRDENVPQMPDLRNEASRYYDTFRERLIFPIMRSNGTPIAFGGRIIRASSDAPKYINSAESPLYAKRRAFFGLSQGLDSIRRSRHVYLVEGYLDVLGSVQAGVRDVLATCGTAVTAEHVQVLKRLIKQATLVFDGDNAGRRAAASCFEVFANSGIEMNAILLPAGEDPDSLARKMTGGEFEAYLRDHRELLVDLYLTELARQEGGQNSDPVAVGRVAQRFAHITARIQNPVEAEFLAKRASDRLGVSVDSINALLNNERRKSKVSHAAIQSSIRSTPDMPRPEAPEIKTENSKLDRKTRPARRQPAFFAQQNAFERYLEQVLVAVLCEPRLAAAILEMPSIFEAFAEEGGTIDRLRTFLGKYIELDFEGLAAVEQISTFEEMGPSLYKAQKDNVARLLEEHGFESKRLMDKGLHQTLIGGAKPDAVIADAEFAAVRHTLQSQVLRTRVESTSDKTEDIAQKAQEKLVLRRNLERLNASRRQSNA